MKKNNDKMCPHYDKMGTTAYRRDQEKTFGHMKPQGKVAPKRVTCPKCGRRIMARVSVDHDGINLIYSIPPHKKKGWWKKPKKQSKDIGGRRR